MSNTIDQNESNHLNSINSDCKSQGGHKPGRHGKPGKLWEFEKLSKSQGKLMEI